MTAPVQFELTLPGELPTPNEIRRQYEELQAEIDVRRTKIAKLRELCQHTNGTAIPKSNTGNYDPSADSYWYDCSCPDCGKQWTVPQ